MTHRFTINSAEVKRGIDPDTFYPRFVHRIICLNTDTFKADIRPEIREWVDENLSGAYNIRLWGDEIYIEFSTAQDLTLFTLRYS